MANENSSRAKKPRARGLGLDVPGTPGEHNALTDVPGVLVGFETLISGPEANPRNRPQIRTGVTAVLPRGFDPVPRPVWAGVSVLNGNGEMTGSHWIRDGGYFIGPVCITNTHSVGIAHHAATRWTIDHYGATWRDNPLWAMPVVAETYDGMLNDIDGQHVKEEHVLSAINAAVAGQVAEGNVGGGTGMICYGFKGGTGTASRRIDIDGDGFTLGALVQANHGRRPWLTVLGVPVGRHLKEDGAPKDRPERGSIIVVIGTDIPALPHQLERIARRATIGIGRGGTPGGNGSGDIFLAFSTANEMEMPQLSPAWRPMKALNDERFDAVYQAAVEAIEEAVINAMLAAEDTPFLHTPGEVCPAIGHDELVEIMSRYGRMKARG